MKRKYIPIISIMICAPISFFAKDPFLSLHDNTESKVVSKKEQENSTSLEKKSNTLENKNSQSYWEIVSSTPYSIILKNKEGKTRCITLEENPST